MNGNPPEQHASEEPAPDRRRSSWIGDRFRLPTFRIGATEFGWRSSGKKFDAQTPIAFNWRSVLSLPAVFALFPMQFFLRAEGWPLAVLFLGFILVVMLPVAALVHLAAKPEVGLDGDRIVVSRAGRTSGRVYYRHRKDCRLWKTPDGKYMLKFFPWIFDFTPGGMTPSRVQVLPRSWNQDRWDKLYQDAPLHK